LEAKRTFLPTRQEQHKREFSGNQINQQQENLHSLIKRGAATSKGLNQPRRSNPVGISGKTEVILSPHKNERTEQSVEETKNENQIFCSLVK
jgi:hypothetical protein